MSDIGSFCKCICASNSSTSWDRREMLDSHQMQVISAEPAVGLIAELILHQPRAVQALLI